MSEFRSPLGETIFRNKYATGSGDTWESLGNRLVERVCGSVDPGDNDLLSKDDRRDLKAIITSFKFIPGGRYLYYSGRQAKFYNNCYLLRAEEDTREGWAEVTWEAMTCLMTGGGIGVDYSRIRPEGSLLKRTGGRASGPIPLMHCINEIGRNVMQGGSRRSAIYASLLWSHGDIDKFLKVKNWLPEVRKLKEKDFNFPAALDMTNVSVNYNTDALGKGLLNNPVFLANCKQAMKTSEPGFSFNFYEHENETLRNACCEVTSEDDSDVCNLGSINIANIETLEEFRAIVSLATKFLVCGTLRADLPYNKVKEVREKNRRLGLGLMGIHEWLLKRGGRYEVTEELRQWLKVYRDESDKTAKEFSNHLNISNPVAVRAIAPTGTIGMLAGTTTGIEPLYAVAYKRRYITEGHRWKYQYEVSPIADLLIKEYGLDPHSIETALSLSGDFERRVRFQADIQDYVDMSISSTINLQAWGSAQNNPDQVDNFARVLAKYASRLRGFTCYPDGGRGGQPITSIDYYDALKHHGVEFHEMDVCAGGVCGV